MLLTPFWSLDECFYFLYAVTGWFAVGYNLTFLFMFCRLFVGSFWNYVNIFQGAVCANLRCQKSFIGVECTISNTLIPQYFFLWEDFICWDVFLGFYMLIWGASVFLGSFLSIKSPTQTNGEVWKTTKNDVYSMKTSA